ncbi:MAG: hypothetical protein ACW96M_01010 [Candidatus Thorarchaeota archaeon]
MKILKENVYPKEITPEKKQAILAQIIQETVRSKIVAERDDE